MSTNARDKIFISYSHKDKKWLERLQIHLSPLIQKYQISIWEDTKIQPGTKWREEIESVINSAKIAILLVSPDYLASDYLRQNELPTLLEAAQKKGLIILWIALRHSAFQDSQISHFQALNDPSKPLAQLKSRAGQDKELVKIREQIEVALGSPSTPPPNQTQSSLITSPEINGQPNTTIIQESPPIEPIGDVENQPTTEPPSSDAETILKQGLADGASEKNAINDKPLDDVKKDTLGFADYVFALRDFISSQETTTPLTISVNGAWGSGKSSLMKMLQHELDPESPENLWKAELKWFRRWLSGTIFSVLGRLLINLKTANSSFISLGLAFEPGIDINKENFDRLFENYIDASIEHDFPKTERSNSLNFFIEETRTARLEKARFWAWKSTLRQKMIPQDYPTIWFNAWKFNEQEQLWSALALAVLDQLKTKYGFSKRIFFLTLLTLKRLDKLETMKHIFQKFLVPLILAGLVTLYTMYKEQLGLHLPKAFGIEDKWVWVAPLLAAIWQALKEIENPFQLPIEKILDKPDYKQKVGFIGTFEEDFSRIVEVVVRRSFCWKPRKLVVFIDDLDRCNPLQAAGIIEAINLFLDSVGCVFVLGMDMAVVAASIEFKYEKLSDRMRQEAPGLLSPGSLFLDKIVQIPFNVPRPNKDYINELMETMTAPKTWVIPSLEWSRTVVNQDPTGQSAALNSKEAVPLSPPRQIGIKRNANDQIMVDRASFEREDIRQAIVFTSRLLKENPRQLKRFVNLFRLQVYIADQRNLISDNTDYGLTPMVLAIWVAWYMQWPEMIKILSNINESLELSKRLKSICQHLEFIGASNERVVKWKTNELDGDSYFEGLKIIEEIEKDVTLYWSKLPWRLWMKDSDFLHSIKYLEKYWIQPVLLESLLDMTQVTVQNTTSTISANK